MDKTREIKQPPLEIGMTSEITDPVAAYFRRLVESMGNDPPFGESGVVSVICDKNSVGGRYPYIIDAYAKVGLHRYKMLKGTNTNLRFSRVIKYKETLAFMRHYWITLVAINLVSGSELEFEVEEVEQKLNCLALTVPMSRPVGEHSSTLEPSDYQKFTLEPLPEWPSEDAFNDTKRFYMVEESELRNTDWIRLYLEIQVRKANYVLKAPSAFELDILKVAIETSNDEEDGVDRLYAKNALFYITFKGFGVKKGIDERIERKAIIRRTINERTGCLSLLGRFSADDPRRPIDLVSMQEREINRKMNQ